MGAPTDRRIEERTDCELAATLAWVGGTTPCVVKDLSETGVRIELAEAITVPAEFDLLVPVVPGANQRFRVALRWRNDSSLGGEFIDGGATTG